MTCPTGDETTPLLSQGSPTDYTSQCLGSDGQAEEQPIGGSSRRPPKRSIYVAMCSVHPRIGRFTGNMEEYTPIALVGHLARKVAGVIPAVMTGLLLNLLDALSYGILIFPPGEGIFAASGPEGISLFYASCIISQLVCSSGSVFKGSTGSQLIEAIPFYHRICSTIISTMGRGNPDAVRATVVVAYALSTIFTGLAFLALGCARLGSLVDLIPRTVLIGCIGGIGVFLLITGVAVSARMEGELALSSDILQRLFSGETIFLWGLPLCLALILLTLKRYFDRPWLLPTCYLVIAAVFYTVASAKDVSMTELRGSGWVFEAPTADVPFYSVYGYFNFHLVNWQAIWTTIPSQLALAFFCILHVPINVPSLALETQQDDCSVDRELVLHGISNTLSGLCGNVQNYLCFVNSMYFINTGGNSRFAGYLLAASTFGLWVCNADLIGYVPITVVATLIYMLGIELAIGALVTACRCMNPIEGLTVVITILTMTFYDFVGGIVMGVGLACLVYVVMSSRTCTLRNQFAGDEAASITWRRPAHREYLALAGSQIGIVKLGGYLFFATIVCVETRFRQMLERELQTTARLRYLIIDFTHVTGIDFSAAETLVRIKRLLHRGNVKMILVGTTPSSSLNSVLQKGGLFHVPTVDTDAPPPESYETLDEALEVCEDRLLSLWFGELRVQSKQGTVQFDPVIKPTDYLGRSALEHFSSLWDPSLEQKEAFLKWSGMTLSLSRHQHFDQRLQLVMHALHRQPSQDSDFGTSILPYFVERTFGAGQSFRGDSTIAVFCILISGSLEIVHHDGQADYSERVKAGAACGELPFFSDKPWTCNVVARSDCTALVLTRERWKELEEDEGDLAKELLRLGNRLSAERTLAVNKYALANAS